MVTGWTYGGHGYAEVLDSLWQVHRYPGSRWLLVDRAFEQHILKNRLGIHRWVIAECI
jgi:hypothetical protein